MGPELEAVVSQIRRTAELGAGTVQRSEARAETEGHGRPGSITKRRDVAPELVLLIGGNLLEHLHTLAQPTEFAT